MAKMDGPFFIGVYDREMGVVDEHTECSDLECVLKRAGTELEQGNNVSIHHADDCTDIGCG